MFIKPEDVLVDIGIKNGMMVADFGCGAGAWTIPSAFLVGESGSVYAFDILNHMLEVTGNRIKKFDLQNVTLVKSNIEDPKSIKLKQKCDIIIISNILFQLKDKNAIFESAKKILRNDGQVLVIDWQIGSGLGPDEETKLSKEKAKEIAENNGLSLVKEIDSGKFHYGLLFKLK